MSGDDVMQTLKQVTQQRGVPESIVVDYGTDELWFLSRADALQKSGECGRTTTSDDATAAWGMFPRRRSPWVFSDLFSIGSEFDVQSDAGDDRSVAAG